MANPHRELSDEQLVHRVLEVERQLVQTRFRHSANQLENTARLRVLRREIARLQTEARRREIANGLAKGELVRTHARSFQTGEAAGEAAQPEQKGGFLSGIVDKLTGKD